MADKRYLNLVFQGGGVRGIAYAGALDCMPDYCEINAVAGTSAGAIVAALLAIGKRKDLRSILADPALLKLVDEDDQARAERLKRAWRDLVAVCEAAARRRKVSMWSLYKLKRTHHKLFSELPDIWSARGLHQSRSLRAFLDQIFEGKRFTDIIVKDLRIVAADASAREYLVYDRERNAGTLLAEAVHGSVSIPLFFTPFMSGPRHLVDGDILSNFPSYLFAQSKYRTIGFRLVDIAAPGVIDSTPSYLWSLLLTMTEAHDRERGAPAYFKEYRIRTPRHIPSWKFDLTKAEVDDLFDSGQHVGKEVDWYANSSSTELVRFYDPKPQESLQFSIEQAYELWERYADKELWVDELWQDYIFTARIDEDWTGHYDRYGTVKVAGNRSLYMSRATTEGFTRRFSLIDVQHVFEEVTPSGNRPLTRIPAVNDEIEKGFLVFYTPPVSQEHSARTFHIGFSHPREFSETVAKGSTGSIGYFVKQLGKRHHLKLKMRILVDVKLPPLDLNTDFGMSFSPGSHEYDKVSRITYQVHECDVGERSIDLSARFEVSVSQKL